MPSAQAEPEVKLPLSTSNVNQTNVDAVQDAEKAMVEARELNKDQQLINNEVEVAKVISNSDNQLLKEQNDAKELVFASSGGPFINIRTGEEFYLEWDEYDEDEEDSYNGYLTEEDEPLLDEILDAYAEN